MRIYNLGGNSISNKERIEEIADRLKLMNQFSHVDFCSYNHRYQPDGNMDFEKEWEKLLSRIASSQEEYVIFCKSAGAVLFLSVVDKLKSLPQKVIMCGFPIGYAQMSWFEPSTILKEYSFPILLLQNENDHAGSFEQVARLLKWVNRWELVKLPGDSHWYAPEVVVEYISH